VSAYLAISDAFARQWVFHIAGLVALALLTLIMSDVAASFLRRCWCRLTSHDWRHLGQLDEEAWIRSGGNLEVIRKIEICRRCLLVRSSPKTQESAHGKSTGG
jgi:hypothetical protein